MPDPFAPTRTVTSPRRPSSSTPPRMATFAGPRSAAWIDQAVPVSAGDRSVPAGTAHGGGRRRRSTSPPLSGTGVQPRPRASPTMGGGSAIVDAATAGGSARPMRPPSTWITSPAAGSSRSRRCSAMSTVAPPATSWRTVASTDSAPPRSSCEVGSSRTRIRGRSARTPAIATRWRSPPDRVSIVRPRSAVDAQALERLAHPPVHLDAADARGSRARTPPRAPPSRRPAASRGPGRRTRPTGPGSRVGVRSTSWPHTLIAPRDPPAVEVRDEAVEEAQERRLATPGRPDDEREALLEPARTSRSAGSARARIPVA